MKELASPAAEELYSSSDREAFEDAVPEIPALHGFQVAAGQSETRLGLTASLGPVREPCRKTSVAGCNGVREALIWELILSGPHLGAGIPKARPLGLHALLASSLVACICAV